MNMIENFIVIQADRISSATTTVVYWSTPNYISKFSNDRMALTPKDHSKAPQIAQNCSSPIQKLIKEICNSYDISDCTDGSFIE